MFNPTTPVAGSAQTGLILPTYTIAQDQSPAVNAKQFVVTSLGGTQTGVTTHSVSSPFSIQSWRPSNYRIPGVPNPVTGVIYGIANNVYRFVTRKGAVPAANQSPRVITIETKASVPAGVDTFSPAELRAAWSAHIGTLSQQSAGIGDTTVQGTM